MEEKKLELVDFAVTARKYKTLLTIKYANRKPYEAPSPFEIRSHIPGTIVKFMVKEGDRVKEGEVLLILEAMKMMNKVLMPYDGKVTKIMVAEGQRVPKNHLIVEISE